MQAKYPTLGYPSSIPSATREEGQAIDGFYFDNAATSFPKPISVEQALIHYHRNIGASAGRGAYPRAQASGRVLDETRALVLKLIYGKHPERMIFTFNASDALNLAIKGIDWKTGDSAVVSVMEHNSVLRPLHALQEKIGIKIIKVPATPQGVIDPLDVVRALEANTRLIAVVHASNVSGSIQPIAEVGKIARSKGIPFLVDAAQSAGALPLDVEAMKIDLLAFPGHKALLGPLGTGGLYIREGLELETLKEGGTGSLSEQEIQPEFLPDRYEPGSHNALGIAGWKAGLEFVLEQGVEVIRAHEEKLTAQFLEGLKDIPGIQVFGPNDARKQVAVVSIRLGDLAPIDLSQKLFERGKVMTRSGLHCAPGAHQSLGTSPIGTTRFSFGFFNTPAEIEHALKTLRAIA